MLYNYVAIEREYGSGGRIIGELTAKECSMSCFSREIPELVSDELSIPVKQIEEIEEKATNSFLYSIFLISNALTANPELISSEDRIYIAQQNIIKKLAYKGPAVFVGRCAACALRDRNDVLRVFIRCDMSKKIERCINEYGLPPDNIEALIKKQDKKRSDFYYANTTRRWNSPENYDIVLDSGTLGTEGCKEAIKGLLRMKSEYDL
ncbi:MAG: cytidylate kinase-like family protein [Oscillospiraceae bacterium]|nr:cytidylate kinase-like family protein [Oscillospiraceae bacterium]